MASFLRNNYRPRNDPALDAHRASRGQVTSDPSGRRGSRSLLNARVRRLMRKGWRGWEYRCVVAHPSHLLARSTLRSRAQRDAHASASVFINKCLGPRATGEMEWRSESALTRSRSSRRACTRRKRERKEQRGKKDLRVCKSFSRVCACRATRNDTVAIPTLYIQAAETPWNAVEIILYFRSSRSVSHPLLSSIHRTFRGNCARMMRRDDHGTHRNGNAKPCRSVRYETPSLRILFLRATRDPLAMSRKEHDALR